ncbi:MAG: hypothetical protein ACD_40C00213G0054 [uncultured bacterium]|nr:MAG: hypothetical protein ACD_40C00213G0054 [uncultured bacterium]KKU14797.1 MAG: hypothetical protein UX21_C0010G0005 [Microgenomates group bacterium GW2011_GWC2_45_8]KKU26238.1 MAG: hypothetical protein UX37_C0004G0033 [Microgenomates group bacterium GW2011_GWA2_46_16]
MKRYSWLIAFLTLVCFVLIFFESVPYLKFIVTSLHVNTITFQWLLLIAWIPPLVTRGFFHLKLLIITLLLCIVGESSAKTSLSIYRELRNITSNPFLTYDQKMSLTYPGFYPAMKEVVRLTPKDSTIIIPPQRNPWETEGHTGMVEYFIYPRQAINMGVDTKQLPQVEGKLYALIAKGSWERIGPVDYGWPKIPIQADHLWHIDTDHNVVTKIEQNYDPQINQWNWGLIEVKK